MNISELPELLPCPFCGGKVKVDEGDAFHPYASISHYFFPSCIDRKSPGHNESQIQCESRREAVEIWNKRAAISELERLRIPQDAILFCPKCHTQHIDKVEPDKCESCGHPESEHFGHKGDDPDDIGCYNCGGITKNGCQFFIAWLNPPHKKHRCHNCNWVWKAANIPTNGVESL